MVCINNAACHDEVRTAAHHLAAFCATGTFTVEAIVAELRRSGCTHSESTIRTHVTSRMCANAPDHHPVVYLDFWRIAHGVYGLAAAGDIG